jgi:hypothetical protein
LDQQEAAGGKLKRYVIYVIDTATNTGGSGEMAAIDAFNDHLQSNSHWITAAGIGAPATAKVIDNREDAGLVTPGSLFDDEEFYSGFWLIQAESDEQAQELALAGSRACNRKVELRPYLGQ